VNGGSAHFDPFPHKQRRSAIAINTEPADNPPVEACLAELPDHLGILKCSPQLVSVVPGSERIQHYQQQILAAVVPAEP
jgi:hypothetical protein